MVVSFEKISSVLRSSRTACTFMCKSYTSDFTACAFDFARDDRQSLGNFQLMSSRSLGVSCKAREVVQI